ncbi:MAG: V-type ATPase 116kDa subunit family protein, partial [bacterium]
MIVPMVKVEVVGPRTRLGEAIAALQDASVLHLTTVSPSSLTTRPASPSPREARRRERLAAALADLDAVLGERDASARVLGAVDDSAARASCTVFAAVRRARRLRHLLAALESAAAALVEERALIEKFRPFLAAFGSWLRAPRPLTQVSAYHVVLRPEQVAALPRLEAALDEALGGAFELIVEPLGGGELALLLIVARSWANRVDAILAASRVHEVELPVSYGASLLDAAPRMMERLGEIPRELAALARCRAASLAIARPALEAAWASLADAAERLRARHAVALDEHVFVIAGWVPEARLESLVAGLASTCGGELVVETIGREHWNSDEPPVVLANPRLFRPFEVITRLVPLPRYGSIDPTPFVAVFFPMFFGLMLGDLGYGSLLVVLAVALGRRTRAGTVSRAVAEMAGVCGTFAALFGIGFGELFGDLGQRALGLHPLFFDRGERVVAFLGLALALGSVHVLLGLVLGVLTNLRVHGRTAAAHAISAVM